MASRTRQVALTLAGLGLAGAGVLGTTAPALATTSATTTAGVAQAAVQYPGDYDRKKFHDSYRHKWQCERAGYRIVRWSERWDDYDCRYEGYRKPEPWALYLYDDRRGDHNGWNDHRGGRDDHRGSGHRGGR